MAITPVPLRSLVNAPGAPAYPANNYTWHAQDWAMLRAALQLGTEGIYTEGIKLGAEGIQVQTTTPWLMDEGAKLEFRDGGNASVVVGSLSDDGELAMTRFTVMGGMIYQAGTTARHEGDFETQLAVGEQANIAVSRDGAEIENLDVFYDSEAHSLRFLSGTFVANSIGEGFAMRNATKVSRISMRVDGVLIVEDVVDPSARPWAYENEREISTATIDGSPIQELLEADGVSISEVSASPRTLQVGLLAGGVAASRLDVGPADSQVNVDYLWNNGGGSGSAATLVTPAERESIGDLVTAVAQLQADMEGKIGFLRMPNGDLVGPTSSGFVQLANSSSTIFDRPGPNTVRAVSTGGGGGGGGVDSITARFGLANAGSSTSPILDVVLGAGLVFSGDSVVPDFGTAAGKVSEGDHDHDGVYSLIGHTHSGVYVPVGGAYADLVGAGKIGTGGAQVASGADARFHTQETDTGTTSLLFRLRNSFGGTPVNGDVAGLVIERGLATDARIIFDETTDVWKAGLSGTEQAIVLTNDSRLSDARVPTAHALDGAQHVGTLPGASVAVALVPTAYTPSGSDLEGHLEGIDNLFASSDLSSQMFHGCGLSTNLANDQDLLGNGVTGVACMAGGKITTVVIQSQLPLAGGSSVIFWITNITKSTHVVALISAGEHYKRLTYSYSCDIGDEIGIVAKIVTGVPAAGIITVQVFK